MATSESILKDVVRSIIQFPQTYFMVIFRPWRIHSLVVGESASRLTPLPFLLFCSFLFLLAWKNLGLLSLEFARREISESMTSGFSVVNLLLKSAPVFLAAVLAAIALSKVITVIIVPRPLRRVANEEISALMWYSIGAQALTFSLLALFPLFLPLVIEGFCASRGWDKCSSNNSWISPSFPGARFIFFARLLFIYILISPFIAAAGYAVTKYRKQWVKPWNLRRWVKPISGIVMIGFASNMVFATTIATMSTIDMMAQRRYEQLPPKVLLVHETTREIRIEPGPDSSLVLRFTTIVYNGSDLPILVGEDAVGLLFSTPNFVLSENVVIDTAGGIARRFAISPREIAFVPVQLMCDRRCVVAVRNDLQKQKVPGFRVMYVTPAEEGGHWARVGSDNIYLFGDAMEQYF